MELDLVEWGSLTAGGAYRHRHNEFIIGYSPLKTEDEQMDNLDENSRSLNVSYLLPYDLGGVTHRLRAGFDLEHTDFVREDTLTRVLSSEIRRTGWYATHVWTLPGNLSLSAGYRNSRFDGTFRTDTYDSFFGPGPLFPYLYSDWVTKNTTESVWTNNAFDVGATFDLNRDTAFFLTCAGSFRTPNVDELADASGDLRPQTGRHLDAGVRGRVSDTLEYGLTLFQTRIEDEIYYGEDPVTSTSFNRNYDEDTVRRGIEIDLKYYPLDALYVWGNYSYTEAEFEGTDARIPLVPRHKATVGVEWTVTDSVVLAVTGTHVGSRIDGNDRTNTAYARLDPYRVVDTKLTYERGAVTFFAGVNNVLDERYSTIAYSETYYPMPGRNVYGGLEWRFGIPGR